MTSGPRARQPQTGKVFGFTTPHRRAFVLRYVLSKTVFFWRDVHRPRFRLFLYEIVYSLCRATSRPPLALRWLRLYRVSTIFGVFNIRPGTIDAACVSPAFERPDLDHLLSRLRERLSAGRSVLFLDIGADVGTYAVSVVNSLRGLGDIRAIAFEPSQSSCELLRRNLRDNGLDTLVTSRQLALGDGSITTAYLRFDPREPGGSGLNSSHVQGTEPEEVHVSTIDAEIDPLSVPDILVLKLDVEGSEIPVLAGARAILAAARETLLLVEDFVDDSVVRYLEETGWSFDDKLTPYNSFWSIHRRDN
jgi:FkbM family methyltransferase